MKTKIRLLSKLALLGKVGAFFMEFRKKSILWISAGVLVILLFLVWLLYFRFHKFTDDAYVMGNQIILTPLHDGIVTNIYFDDTFPVKQGDLLVQLDETDFSLALGVAKETLANTTRQICQMYHELFAFEAEIEVRQAEYIKACQDMQHRDDVIDRGGVSIENYEHAQAALKASYFSLERTKSLYQKQNAFLKGVSIRSHPLIAKAVDDLVTAWVELYRCKIYAPNDGLIAQRKVQVGMRVKAGDPLLAVIPLDQIWVNANYKETQMRHMHVGQKVRVTSDYYGRAVPFDGTIVGLPGGAGNAFSLLPPQNLSGNWIKIVQRLPVRIQLDPKDLEKHPLRIGLTMTANTNIGDRGCHVQPPSPEYATNVLKKEEEQGWEIANVIFQENMDPELNRYIDNPL